MRIRKKIILAVVAAIVVAGGWRGYARAKKALEEAATATLTQLTGADVKLKIVGVKLSGAVLIDDIVVRPKDRGQGGGSGLVARDSMGETPIPHKVDDAIFKAKHIQAKFGLLSLLRREPRLKMVAVEDFVVNAQYDVNEARWNTEVLKALRSVGSGNTMPEMRLRRGTIKYSKVCGGEAVDVIALPVDATFKTFGEGGDTLSVDVRGAGGALLSGTWRTGLSGRIMLSGRISTASVPLFENVWDMSKIAIVASYDANTINIEDCRMQLGDETTLSANGRIEDYRRRGIFDVKASIKNLHHGPDSVPNTFVYSKSLLENLPGTVCQKFFKDFSPRGVVDINVTAKGAFNELSKTTCTGVLQCKDVSVLYKDFPYPIDHIKGTINFNNKMTVLNKLSAKHGDADMVIEGYSKDFLPVWDCNLIITSPSMTLDDDLYKALDVDQKRAWAVISPTGHIGMKYQFIRKPDGKSQMFVMADLKGVDATYRQFQFPLRNLTGTMMVDLHNDRTAFDNVVSEYEGRRILINGWTKLKGQKWSEESMQDTDSFCMTLDAGGMELEKDVAPLLPPKAAQKLASLKASGKVRLIAHISNNAGQSCDQKSVTIECLGDSINYSGFSYPLRDIRGKLTLAGDEVKFEDMTAVIGQRTEDRKQKTEDREQKTEDGEHGHAALMAQPAAERIILNGSARIGEAGLKDGQFKIGAANIVFDQRLGRLLGEGGHGIYQRLSPTGTADFDVNELKIVKDGNEVNSVDVRGGILFKDCGFTSMLPITAMKGKLNIDASYKNGGSLKSIARVDINSVKVEGKLLEKLLADVTYDESARMLNINNISADFYGGRFIGTFILADVNQNGAGYTLSAMCDRINLREFLTSEKPGESPDYISGVMSGTLDVNSQGPKRSGILQLNITDMKVEKLSLFGKLLAVLKLTEPQDYAFDKMVVTAYIRDKELVVEQMDLNGNAFGLRGEGKVDLAKNTLDLQFVAAGPRLIKEPSMLKSLTEGLTPAMARVHVTGTLQEPKIEQTALPALKDTFELLGKPKEK